MSKSDGSITFSMNVDNSKAAKKLNDLEKKIAEVEKEIEEKQTNKNAIAEQLDAADAAAEEARKKIKQLNAEMEQSYNTPVEAWGRGDNGTQPEEAARQKEITAELERQNAILQEEASRADKLAAEFDRANNALSGPTKKLDKMKWEAGELTEEINYSSSAMGRMKAATTGADKRMEKFANRVKGLAKRVFVFSLITSALRAMKDWFGKVIKTNSEATAAIAKLKGALLTLVQPLVNVIIPAFTTLVNVLTKIVSTVAALVAKIFGTTAAESAAAAEALYNQTEALESTGEAAEDAGKSLAGFDEINQLDDGSSSGGSSSSSSSSITPDFSGQVGDGISGVTQLFTGLALVALGAILTFTGASIPAGLAMMAAGAMLVYGAIKENPNEIVEAMQGPIGVITAIVSAALLALGAILAFTGVKLPLGIALMALGAVGLAATVAINWDTITGFIAEHIDVIIGIVTGAVLVLGAILALTGVNLPLGVGLLMLGAVGLAAEVGLNWDTISEALKGPIGIITGIVSAALIVVGAILAFSGANLPLGVGLLILGAVSLGTVVELNWDTISNAMKGPIGAITAIVGGALLVLGAILLLTGAAAPLGLGLIVAGGAALATAIIPNWNFLTEKLQEAWKSVKKFWKRYIAPVFTAEWWGNLAKTAMNGLISKIESGINTALSGAGEFVNGIVKLLNKIPGVDIGYVNWGNVKLPRLATGTVVPPNREFLAVLGDNKKEPEVVSPVSTMKQAFLEAMREIGGTGGVKTIVIKPAAGLTRYLKYELDEESQRQGTSIVGVTG